MRFEAYRLWKRSQFRGVDDLSKVLIPTCVLSVIRYGFTAVDADIQFSGKFRIHDSVFVGREFAIGTYY